MLLEWVQQLPFTPRPPLHAQVAGVGYATFGDAVFSDLLASYPRSRVLGVARLALSVVVALSYPLQSHPSLGCLISISARAARACDPKWDPMSCSEVSRPHGGASAGWRIGGLLTAGVRRPAALRAGFALLFLVATTSVALAVTRLGLVLAAVGATGSTTVTFIVPGAAYLALAGQRRAMRVLAGVQLLTGLVLVPTCIALLITA